MKTSTLFANIENTDYEEMIRCLKPQYKTISKNNYLTNVGELVNEIFVVIEGNLNVIQDDFLGNRTLITTVAKGEIFGAAYAFSDIKYYPVSLMASEYTKVMIINPNLLITPCAVFCNKHKTVIKNLIQILSAKNTALMNRINNLSQRTTKDKVIAFLSIEAKKHHSLSFVIPFNRQELADYLAVDRSALSNELSKLKREGIIDYQRNYFILKQEKNG